jgi:hypothetical protein
MNTANIFALMGKSALGLSLADAAPHPRRMAAELLGT